MKKLLLLFGVSLMGGVSAIAGYKMFFETNNTSITKTNNNDPNYYTTSNLSNAYNTGSNLTPNLVIAAEKTLDAVVHVKNTAVVSAPMSFADFFYGRNSQIEQVGTGSGVIISPTGYIVTNNHVIENAKKISITLNNNKTYNAELIGTDETTDIALLKIDVDNDLPFITFGNSDNSKVGEWVLAVGNPFNLNSTVTAGIISAKSRDLTGTNSQSFIQTDAAVNSGNSGGALVNINGDLIGINTAISSRTGSYIGYSFAVPSNIVRKIVNDIMEFGTVQNGILGVTGGPLDSKMAEKLGINTTEGFYVNSVQEGTGAAVAGIKEGDIIKKLDNVDINKFSDLKGYLKTKSPNDYVDVTILRNGNNKVVSVKLNKPEYTLIPIVGTVKNATKNELNKHNTSYGVKIVEFTDNEEVKNYWKSNGINEGSIITKINGEKIYNIDTVEKVINKRSRLEGYQIEVINNKGEKELHNFR